MTRSEALAAGLSVYWTGVPCKHGHLANRYVRNWTCVVCHATKAAEFLPKWTAKNPEKIKQYVEKYAAKKAITNKIWNQQNREKCNQYAKNWHANNKAKSNVASKDWRKRNRDVMNALKMARHADILKRTPKWLSSDEKWMMKQAYEIAKVRTEMTGLAWHVDHVLPLRGKFVSGLHVPSNLQVIPAIDNLKKSNQHVVC